MEWLANDVPVEFEKFIAEQFEIFIVSVDD